MSFAVRFLILLTTVVLSLAIPAVVGAQETTSESSEVLTRYDSEETRQMSEQYEADRQREAELEEEVDALEEQGEYGDEWDAKREELLEIEDETDLANRLGDGRLRDIEDAPLPENDEEKAGELRRKADSLYALQTWADSAPIDISSELYYWGAAEDKADEYRAEAEALEAASVVSETTEQTIAEETSEAGAAPSEAGEGEEQPVGDPEPEAPAESPVEPGEDTGFLAGMNLIPVAILAAGALAGVYLVVRRYGGGGLGRLTESFSGLPKAPKPRATKPTARPVSEATVSEPREEPQGSEPQRDTRMPSQGEREARSTPPGSPGAEEAALDDESLAAWFAREMGEAPEEKEEPSSAGDVPGGVPDSGATPKKDVNQMVAEEVARMRETGELRPEDEVEVRMVNGRIVVQRKE